MHRPRLCPLDQLVRILGHGHAPAPAPLEHGAQEPRIHGVVFDHHDVSHAASCRFSSVPSVSSCDTWTCHSTRCASSIGLSCTAVFATTSSTRPSFSSRCSSLLRASGKLVSTSTG